ncbi:DUF58 domain-containing protein [Rheinheimera sp. WS51]|uniref:DUF58 domain-containing protein n=1 Tax=Rheinheimera sp. WS51 TaxID=3425886 RepID=UPI003D8C7BB7
MFNLKAKLYSYYWSWLSRWLDKRQPSAERVSLKQRYIFILPTAYGFWFALLCLLLYLLGTNYQNNLILLVCYFLLSLFLISIVLSFRNLNGLTLSCSDNNEGFVQQDLVIAIHCHTKIPRYMLQFQFMTMAEQLKKDCIDPEDSVLTMTTAAIARGQFSLPRLKISSHYPFGLWRSWSYIALAQQYWVYPKPIKATSIPDGHTNNAQQPLETEISQNLRQYQTGDSLNQILWKRLAKDSSKPIVRLRQPVQQHDPKWVTIPDLTGAALEHALSLACEQLIALEANGQLYGLTSPAINYPPSAGSQHLQRCLQHLALFRC